MEILNNENLPTLFKNIIKVEINSNGRFFTNLKFFC